MKETLTRHPEGFLPGYTPISEIGGSDDVVRMNFGILKLQSGEKRDLTSELESAYLLMSGKTAFTLGDQTHTVERNSIFDEDPYTFNFTKQTQASAEALTDCEFVVCQVVNEVEFDPKFFAPEDMFESEHRGKGLLDDTAYRIVRTVFDIRNHPQSKMVIGEVITFPGRWSSYPPHHHDQPEIYHYRFTEAQGYGHAELGEEVCKIKQYDTIKITDLKDHAQTSAPGYGMYYLWAIRHLPNDVYTVPDFTEEHRWLMEKDAPIWQPKQKQE